MGAFSVLAIASVLALSGRWLGISTDSCRVTNPQSAPFLGGSTPDTHAWSRFHIRYYAVALLFVAFEMEMMFMYPWAVVFVEEGIKALVEMGMFLAILSLGILYAWKEGAFRWQ
ncbi:MAG: NADH-quinone oxidoreductase subunit A [Actinobacteria bacterium]|nr:NADH-quinone oxidoreductase subunit A [Actinomycetota bacterium]